MNFDNVVDHSEKTTFVCRPLKKNLAHAKPDLYMQSQTSDKQLPLRKMVPSKNCARKGFSRMNAIHTQSILSQLANKKWKL
jgi:hypothetical protein